MMLKILCFVIIGWLYCVRKWDNNRKACHYIYCLLDDITAAFAN